MQPVSCHTLTWRGDLPRALRDLSALGFRTFEGNYLPDWFARPADLHGLVTRLSVRPVGLYLGGSHISERDRGPEMRLAEEGCAFLQRSGASHIVVGGGHVRYEGPMPEDYANLAESLQLMGLVAQDHGLVLCYHPHVGTLVETPEDIKRIADLTDPSLVSFCFDVAHLAAAGGDPVALCAQYWERLAYVHLKDLSRSGSFVELGHGSVNLKGVVGLLVERTFGGPIVLELDSSPDPYGSAERNRDYAVGELGLWL